MLDLKDLESLFHHGAEAGFEEMEVYCECTHTVTVRYWGRTDDIRFQIRRGTSLRARRNSIPHHFYVDGTNARALIAALEGGAPTLNALASDPTHAKMASEIIDGAGTILQTVRSAFSSQNERLSAPEITATLSRKNYQVIREGGQLAQGAEEFAELRAEWMVDGVPFICDRARGSVAGLLAEIAAVDGVASLVKRSLTPVTRWPAPQGALPVLWSPRSVAKIQMLFLRAFEGDLVVGNRSFLTSLSLPTPLSFTLEDRPMLSGDQVDHEGSERKRTMLWRDGRPTALACNKRVAGQLEVPPTGHARRESFESPATVGFWHPHLEGANARDSLLAEMERGISVREMEVLAYDPASGEAALRLSDCRLIHHGAEGEPIEPMVLRLPLIDLLASFETFETAQQTTGLATSKQSQHLYTEITTSAALSKPIPLPGSVPLEHYW
jgi:predicted Zn-dependent protease